MKTHLIEFADAVYEGRNLLAKLFFDIVERRGRILYHIMEDGRGDRLGIHVHVGQLICDSNRMGDEGIARHACLPLMRSRAELVRVHDLLDMIGRHIGFKCFEQPLHAPVTSRGRARYLGEN